VPTCIVFFYPVVNKEFLLFFVFVIENIDDNTLQNKNWIIILQYEYPFYLNMFISGNLSES